MSNSHDTSTELSSLEDRIDTITDLYNRFQGLRQIPTLVLKPPSINDLPAPSPLRSEFDRLKDIGEHVKSQKVQEALRAARDSEKTDKDELSASVRRENRKRR